MMNSHSDLLYMSSLQGGSEDEAWKLAWPSGVYYRDSFEDQNKVPFSSFTTSYSHKSLSKESFLNLKRFVIKFFPSENVLSNASSRSLWNPILKSGHLNEDKQ